MVHSHTSKGTRVYRYYVCSYAQKQGAVACPSGTVPALEIERFVVERVRAIARDGGDPFDGASTRRALAEFDAAWEGLTPSRRCGALRHLVRGVAYDGAQGTVSVTFNPGGVVAWAPEVEEEVRA